MAMGTHSDQLVKVVNRGYSLAAHKTAGLTLSPGLSTNERISLSAKHWWTNQVKVLGQQFYELPKTS